MFNQWRRRKYNFLCNVQCSVLLCIVWLCGGTARTGSSNKTKSIISRQCGARGVWARGRGGRSAAWPHYSRQVTRAGQQETIKYATFSQRT